MPYSLPISARRLTPPLPALPLLVDLDEEGRAEQGQLGAVEGECPGRCPPTQVSRTPTGGPGLVGGHGGAYFRTSQYCARRAGLPAACTCRCWPAGLLAIPSSGQASLAPCALARRMYLLDFVFVCVCRRHVACAAFFCSLVTRSAVHHSSALRRRPSSVERWLRDMWCRGICVLWPCVRVRVRVVWGRGDETPQIVVLKLIYYHITTYYILPPK